MRKSLDRFSRAAAAQRVTLFGVRVLFRTQPMDIPQPSVDPSLVLESGGYREDAVFKLRFPASVQPPPAPKEVVTEVATGRRYHITTCVPAATDAPHVHEHIVEARLA